MALRFIYNPDNCSEAKNTAYLSWCYGYFDTKMNQKVKEALFQNDSQKRAQLYADLQREFMQKGLYVFIYQTMVLLL